MCVGVCECVSVCECVQCMCHVVINWHWGEATEMEVLPVSSVLHFAMQHCLLEGLVCRIETLQ